MGSLPESFGKRCPFSRKEQEALELLDLLLQVVVLTHLVLLLIDLGQLPNLF